MRFLIAVVCMSLSFVASARSYVVTADTAIRTDNWYPLPKEEMKAAAVDVALSELTGTGRFEIIDRSNNASRSLDGALQFDIALVGPAEIVKLTASVNLKNHATYVSSVSMDIHGMDYRGIYTAFEYVGREAAKRLNTKMVMQLNSGLATRSATDDDASKSGPARLFDRAQELKRQEQLDEARVLFEQVIEQGAGSQWATMAEDELSYGLPIFEAEALLANNAMGEPDKVMRKMVEVGHLYREILADNLDKPQRVMDINRRLDRVSLSIKHMNNAVRANAMSRAGALRMMLTESCMMDGAWPGRKRLEQLIQDSGVSYDIVRYQRDKGKDKGRGELVVNDRKYDVELTMASEKTRPCRLTLR